MSMLNQYTYECICKQVYFRKSTFDDHIFREHDTKKFPKLAKNSNRCQKCGIVPTTLRLDRLHFYWRHTHRDVDSSKIMKCKICKSPFDSLESLKKHLVIHRKNNCSPNTVRGEGKCNLMSNTKIDQPTSTCKIEHFEYEKRKSIEMNAENYLKRNDSEF